MPLCKWTILVFNATLGTLTRCCSFSGVSAVGLTLVLNFVLLALSIVKLIAAGAEVNKSTVLHQELLASCQLHMRHSHSQQVGADGQGSRSEAAMSAHDRMFDSAMRTLEICDLREPVEILGMRASNTMLSPVRADGHYRTIVVAQISASLLVLTPLH